MHLQENELTDLKSRIEESHRNIIDLDDYNVSLRKEIAGTAYMVQGLDKKGILSSQRGKSFTEVNHTGISSLEILCGR